MTPDEELRAWGRWRTACAFGLLEEADRAELHRVVGDRFRSRLRKLGGRLAAPADAECAHLFESWCALHPRRDGKRYKEWLLARGRRDLDTVQSGVMLLIRNVVREWIRQAHPKTAELSLDQPLGPYSPCTLRDLLPERVENRLSAEVLGWVAERAVRLAAEAEPVAAAALRLRARGRVFSGPRVKAETGFGKTALHKHHRLLLERLAEELRDRFPELEAADATAAVLEILDRAGEEILSKFSAENPAPRAFGSAEPEPED